MKSAALCILLMVGICTTVKGDNRRVLFLGNSYTAVNNLPQMTADMAASTSDTLFFDSNSPGGYTFYDHLISTVSKSKIMNSPWDYVALQEQSQIPALPNYSGDADAYDLCKLIRNSSPCARPLFYMTWGRKNGDVFNCPAWPPVCTYAGMDSLLRLQYLAMAAYNHAQVSPVGVVWNYIRQNYPGINLYQVDDSHPEVAGTYLAACCFYTSIFKKNPTAVTFNSTLIAGDAAIIRQAVKDLVYDSLSKWNFVDTIPVADFSYIAGNGVNELIFQNESTNAHSYYWDFGDGTNSLVKNPTHNYLNNGSYVVTLTSTTCDLTNTYFATHQITLSICPHNPTIFPDSLILCPNLTDTIWTQPYDAYQWFNAIGDSLPNETHQYLVPRGGTTYSVMTTLNNCTELSPQVYVSQYSNNTTYQVRAEGNLIGQDTACEGDTLKLIVSPTRPPFPDMDSTVQWFYNGMPVSNSHEDTLLITSSGQYGVMLLHSYCPLDTIYQTQDLYYYFSSCTQGIDETNINNTSLCYPNPVKSVLTITIHQPGFLQFKIVAASGSEAMNGMIDKSTNQIDVRVLSPGFYILQLFNAHATIGRQRFIKLSE